MNNLTQRTLSGIVYLVVVIGALFLGEYSYGALFLIITILALVEFYNIQGFSEFDRTAVVGISAGAAVFILSFLCASGVFAGKYIFLVAVIPLIFLISGLYIKTTPLNSIGTMFFGFLYVALPLSAINLLAFPEVNANYYSHRIVLGILTLVWINDTGAYVSGMLFGKHRLFARISPKKSWEGFAGGTIFTFAAALIMTRLMAILSREEWIILAGIVSVFGVFGDLVESLIKRNAQIKDSGTLIPGHGGVLDRFDSLLFVVPVSVIYFYLSGF